MTALALCAGLPGLTAHQHGERLTLATADFAAELSLAGGQLLGYAPTGQRPWLYLSPQARSAAGKAIRGGVPLCWPWFGAHPDDPGQPAHGVARTAPWRLDDARLDAGVLALQLSGPHHGGLAATLTLELGPAGFALTLATRNDGTAPVRFSQALHSYFAVGDCREVTLSGLEAAGYDDKVDGGRHPASGAPLRFTSETDRIYYPAPDAVLRLADPQWQRVLTLAAQGSGSSVVWNPWVDKAAALADLPDDAWPRFVCVETANAGDDARVLAPGATQRLGVRVSAGAFDPCSNAPRPTDAV
ncbi:D-hexose-6-phosphate mutarotase [Crenobacter sp. SG2303]|uniref:Putative glucose-6-phosphate 1-epimerase n=1 Tax=Crenobacter oryzisoli TaxID=3056844 RepID=A0ABT7XTY2_9NEIS|nr:D-hexose-6-phosphate mutarotase [Crenobacter sp. SG2303]MDN0077185.1 D-hexose-6-phosphate mutarotase [Crenobacter sp. SG2303]